MQSLRKVIQLNWRCLVVTGSFLSVWVLWPISAGATHRAGHGGGTPTPEPIITVVSSISFGNAVVAGNGTITIDPLTGAISASGGVVPSGSYQRAQFLIRGTVGSYVAFTLPTSVELRTGPSRITFTPNHSASVTTIQIPADGRYILNVGGTIGLSTTNRLDPHSGLLTLSALYTTTPPPPTQ